MNGSIHLSIHNLLWSCVSYFCSKPFIKAWPPDLKSRLLLCFLPQVSLFFTTTASEIILLVFTFLSFHQLFLFIDPINTNRVPTVGISQTLFPSRARALSLLIIWTPAAEDIEGPYRRAACPPQPSLCLCTSNRSISECRYLPADWSDS